MNLKTAEDLERENLEQENAALRDELDKLNASARGGLTEAQEKIVREKVSAGLSRAQAIEVLRAQEAWDVEQLAKSAPVDAQRNAPLTSPVSR